MLELKCVCEFLRTLVRGRTGNLIRIALSSIGETLLSKEGWFLPSKELVKSYQFYIRNSSWVIPHLFTPTATAIRPMLFCSVDQEDGSPCCFPTPPVCPQTLSNMLGVQDSENRRTTNERQKNGICWRQQEELSLLTVCFALPGNILSSHKLWKCIKYLTF